MMKGMQQQLERLKEGFLSGADNPEHDVKPPEHPDGPECMVVRFDLGNVAKTVLVVMLLVLFAAFLVKIKEILLIVFVSFLLSSALIPTVDWLHKRKVPRPLSVILIYVVAFGALIAFISSFIPTLGGELLVLGRNIQDLLVDLTTGDLSVPALSFVLDPLREYVANVDLDVLFNDLEGYLLDAGKQLSSLAGNAVGVLIAFSNGLLNLLLVMVLTFLFIIERDAVSNFVVAMFPARYKKYILAKNKAIQTKIGYWLQGQVVLMAVITVITYVALLVLGVEYALTLAAFAGLAELLPVVGPLLALLVALPIAANQALWLVAAVAILFFVIQQLENNVLVPMIMNKAVGLNPIVVILAMLIGFQFLGVLGLIISVPVASTVNIFLSDYLKR